MVIMVVRSREFVLAAVTDHARLPMSVRLTVVTELSEVRVLTAARVNEGVFTHIKCLRGSLGSGLDFVGGRQHGQSVKVSRR